MVATDTQYLIHIRESRDEKIIRRFKSKIIKTNYCWNWAGTVGADGYGIFTLGQKLLKAHRVSYFLYLGSISGSILHKCNNKLCVNPSHLYDGDTIDNMRDWIKSGGGNGKLTKEQVLKIRELSSNEKISQEKLSRLFGVSKGAIQLLLEGRSYTWI